MPRLPTQFAGAATTADLATAAADIQAAQVQVQFQALLAAQAARQRASQTPGNTTDDYGPEQGIEQYNLAAVQRRMRREHRRQQEQQQQEQQEELERHMNVAQQRLIEHQRHLLQQQQLQVQQELYQQHQDQHREHQRHQQSQLQQRVNGGNGNMADGSLMENDEAEDSNMTQELDSMDEHHHTELEMGDSQMVGDMTHGTVDDSRDEEEDLANLKEIGNLASWTVSTAKPSCGVAALRDEDTELFWQSDGPQPHSINIHFAKRVFIKRIRIYLDYISDESYTPTKISILSGTGYHNLQEVTSMALEQPHGWIDVDLSGVHEDGILRTFLIQVGIHANHQNGKDTHVRGLQIFSPTKMLEGNLLALDAEETATLEAVSAAAALSLSSPSPSPQSPISLSSPASPSYFAKSPSLAATSRLPAHSHSPHTPVLGDVAGGIITPLELLRRKRKQKRVVLGGIDNVLGGISHNAGGAGSRGEEIEEDLLAGLGDLPDEKSYEIPFTTEGMYSEFEIR